MNAKTTIVLPTGIHLDTVRDVHPAQHPDNKGECSVRVSKVEVYADGTHLSVELEFDVDLDVRLVPNRVVVGVKAKKDAA